MCPTTESTPFVLLTTFCFEYFSAVILRAAAMEISPETDKVVSLGKATTTI